VPEPVLVPEPVCVAVRLSVVVPEPVPDPVPVRDGVCEPEVVPVLLAMLCVGFAELDGVCGGD